MRFPIIFDILRSAEPRRWAGVAALAAGLPLASLSAASLVTWRESTPAPEPRAGYAAGVIGGKLILVGGTYWEGEKGNWTKKVFAAAADAFDPQKQTWEKLADCPVTLGYPACTQVGETIYVLGGLQNGEASSAIRTLKKTGAKYEWRAEGALPEPRLFAAAVTIGRTIYVVGGARQFEPFDAIGTCCTTNTVTATVWAFDTANPAKGWKTLAPVPGGLRWQLKAVTDGTDIFVFGGSFQAKQGDPVKKLKEVLRYEVAKDSWTTAGEMPESMQGSALVPARGLFFLLGSKNQVMTFDPKTTKFAPADPLPRDVYVDYFAWIDPFLVGATGETAVESPRRRSPWTFIGRLGGLSEPRSGR